MIRAVLRLRRDNDYNYTKIKDKFIPANGEICLVDTARDGLRAVCGDGIKTFGELEFLGDLIQKGFYKDGNFYKDNEFSELLNGSTIKIYIDVLTNQIYYFDSVNYISLGSGAGIPTASAQQPGVMKLYSETGQNTDGTMTQKAITDKLNEKFEVTLDAQGEMIIFS